MAVESGIAVGKRAPNWRARLDSWVESARFQRVIIALVPAAGTLSVFRALRALRVLRILRLVSVVPRLRAVVATKLFAADFPQWFGSLWTSMFSLFQIMTLEAWAEIAREVKARYSAAWLLFVTFILLATFTVLSLFIALIVKAMEDPSVGPPASRQPGRSPKVEIRWWHGKAFH